ncbi:MAG: flagellar motor switch phosphatase FliY [Alicyclobacillus sp.]|nr:flagellar motor switch phosphatase FliY [Alicyclobacillus sp.]
MAEHGKLSQAEIDALLNKGLGGHEVDPAGAGDPELSLAEMDLLGEIGNISFGSAATALSSLLRQRVEITTPKVTLLPAVEVRRAFPHPCVTVTVEYVSGLQGQNVLAVNLRDARVIADLMLGGTGESGAGEVNELHVSAVAEAMNQMMGGAASAMSTIFSRSIHISSPKVRVTEAGSEGFEWDLGDWLVQIVFRMRVGTLIDSELFQFLPLSFAREMVASVRAQRPSGPEPAPARAVAGDPPATPAAGAPSQPAASPSSAKVAVSRPEFAEFSRAAEPKAAAPRNLSLLYDVPLNVTVELGRTRRPIKEILELAPGSILELDKLAGEPVDILVNNKRIAVGEVVVIDENFGVRVTDIISPIDRVKNLQ